MTKQIVRHGDLLLIPCDSIPLEATLLKTKTLALGEVTGHHHTMKGQAQVYMSKGQKYVKAQKNVILEHQEHKTIPIEEGSYKLVTEQEFDPFESQIMRVRD